MSNDYNRLGAVFAQWLEEFLAPLSFTGEVLDGVRYAVSGAGKRLRPVITLGAAELLGVELEEVRGFAVGVELLHTATLIHDDLPSLDNDDTRRGRPTVHRIFGDGEAVLIGDLLFTEAFRVAATEGSASAEGRARVVELLARAGSAVNEGQVLDLRASGELQLRHEKKTASLIASCFSAPAVVRGDKEAESLLWEAGMKFGLLFQVTDDILDVTGDEGETGKPGASDERQGRVSYTSLYGVEGSQRIAQALSAEITELLRPFGSRSHFLVALTHSLLERKK